MSVVNARPSSPTAPPNTQIVKPVVANARPSSPTAPPNTQNVKSVVAGARPSTPTSFEPQIANAAAIVGASPYIKASEVERAHEMRQQQQQQQVQRVNAPTPTSASASTTTAENCPHCQKFVNQAQAPAQAPAQAQQPGFWGRVATAAAPIVKKVASNVMENVENKFKQARRASGIISLF